MEKGRFLRRRIKVNWIKRSIDSMSNFFEIKKDCFPEGRNRSWLDLEIDRFRVQFFRNRRRLFFRRERSERSKLVRSSDRLIDFVFNFLKKTKNGKRPFFQEREIGESKLVGSSDRSIDSASNFFRK